MRKFSDTTATRREILRRRVATDMVRDHVVDLASHGLTARLQELRAMRNLGGEEYRSKKEQVLVRLKRLMPGNTSGLDALEDPVDKTVFTDPRDMARILTEHWGRVLTARPVNRSLLNTWLREMNHKLAHASEDWKITQGHLSVSIRRAHETTPGPDGIPYCAYKCLGSYASSFLHDVAEDMQDKHELPSMPAGFNKLY